MFVHRMVSLLLIVSLTSVTHAFGRDPVEAFKPITLGQAKNIQRADAVAEREEARRDFISARKEFADALASVMTTEQLAARARELTVEMQLERARERLSQVRRRLRSVEGEGRGESDEARRLTQRAVRLAADVASQRKFLEGSVNEQNEGIVTKVIVGQFQKEMAEETEYLADVLETEELAGKAARLRQMAKLGQFATGLKTLEDEPAQIHDEPPEIGTATGPVKPENDVE